MKKLYTIILILIAVNVQAQQDFIMYNWHDVPQAGYSHPSNRFNGKWYLGLPGLSSNYFSLSNSGFAYSDAIKKSGSDLLLDFNSLISELNDNNFLALNAKIDLLSFGFSLSERTQLTFNVTQNTNFRFSYPKDFIEFIYRGNGSVDDPVADFEGIGVSLNLYNEYGVGFSHQLTQQLRIGARAKYLYGIANIYSRKTDISLTTDPTTFALTAKADMEINTSGFNDADFGEILVGGSGNNGFGLDLGGFYELNDKLSFNASVLDLGFINWNNDVKTYSIANGEYTYDGIEVNEFAGVNDGPNSNANSGNNETSFDRVLDSLESEFNLVETEDGYVAPLTARFYMGANYKLNESTMVGGIFQSEVFQRELLPSFTVSVDRKMTKWITLGATYTMIHGTFNNLGFGFNINPGPVQFYMVSDNLLGAIQPQNARYAQLRFGINLVFGSEKTKEINPSFKGKIEPREKKEAKEEKEPKEKKVKKNDAEEEGSE